MSRGTLPRGGSLSSDGGPFVAVGADGAVVRQPSGYGRKKRPKAFKALGSIFTKFLVHR